MPDYDEEADALGSFRVAMDEIGRRGRAGEPLVATGYFARPGEQLDLFQNSAIRQSQGGCEPVTTTPQPYQGWQPDPMSAGAHAANWTLMIEGVLRPGQDVWAALFREIADRKKQ
jgi:hypothetical protein